MVNSVAIRGARLVENDGSIAGGIIRFGVFEVDLRAGELRKQGVKIKLQAQPFQVLQILLEKPGELLSREELRARLWPSDTFVDFDGGVNNAVKRLREALGDSADTPRYVETVPRRGYRFIGAVNGAALAIPVSGSPPTAEPRVEAGVRRRTLGAGILMGLGLTLLLLTVLALSANKWWQRPRGEGKVPEIELQLTSQGNARLTPKAPVNPKAVNHYLEGRYHLNKSIDEELLRGHEALSEDEWRKAVELFRRATEDDPDYVRAYLGLFDALDSPDTPHLELLPEAKAAVDKALSVDETVAEAHRDKAILLKQYEYDWSWSRTGRELQRALEFDPNSADLHDSYFSYLLEMGQRDEAKAEKNLTRYLQYRDSPIALLGHEDQVNEQREYLQSTNSTDPRRHWYLAKCLETSGRYDEAIAEWEKTMTLTGFTELAEALRRGYATGGYKGALREWSSGLEEQSRHRYFPRIVLAMVHIHLGDWDQAFVWLEKAREEHNWAIEYLDEDSLWDPIRSDPRFNDLKRRVGLPAGITAPTAGKALTSSHLAPREKRLPLN